MRIARVRATPNFLKYQGIPILPIIIILALVTLQSSPIYPSSVEAASSTYPVTIIDYAFQPLHINITTGTTVIWTYSSSGKTIHTVTSDPGTNQSQGAPLLGSGDLNPGQSYSYTFNLPGYYPYQCEVHPTIASMNGWVNVTGNPISTMPSSASSFSWLLPVGIATIAVVLILLAWLVISRKRKQP